MSLKLNIQNFDKHRCIFRFLKSKNLWKLIWIYNSSFTLEVLIWNRAFEVYLEISKVLPYDNISFTAGYMLKNFTTSKHLLKQVTYTDVL